MYIYNVTINIDQSVHEQWEIWIKNHIPEVLATGHFLSAKLTQVLVEEEMGGTTYSVQYTAKTRENLDAYYNNHADEIRAESFKKFGDKMLTFRTELRVVNEFFPSIKNN